jgi:cytosine deaminase
VCGHCCSLAVQDESEADRTMDLVAEAGLTVVSLPLCNLYLQDRNAGAHAAMARRHPGA